MGFEENYRVNIAEARRNLLNAQEKVERLKAAGLIMWGKIRLKSGSNYEGWLVKGEGADAVYGEMLQHESDLAHWQKLLSEESRNPAPVFKGPDFAIIRELADAKS